MQRSREVKKHSRSDNNSYRGAPSKGVALMSRRALTQCTIDADTKDHQCRRRRESRNTN